MENSRLISIREFCRNYGVEHTFILELREFGLIEIEEEEFLHRKLLPKVEKIIRFQNDLNINLEGIDVIFDLLEKVHERDKQIRKLQNRLKIYE